jgi:hypothetical protein
LESAAATRLRRDVYLAAHRAPGAEAESSAVAARRAPEAEAESSAASASHAPAPPQYIVEHPPSKSEEEVTVEEAAEEEEEALPEPDAQVMARVLARSVCTATREDHHRRDIAAYNATQLEQGLYASEQHTTNLQYWRI